ncbi:MAG: hydantoinase B/oxoprolinase family protein [Clostridia bacterium]|nr:MAG: hydantoinase B/oxoprolinase family protein [Clostridia bacterium]
MDKLDQVTFEVLKNRVMAVNNEQAIVAARMSGSSVCYDAYDFNTAITTAEGRGLYIGLYNTGIGHPITMAIQSIISSFGTDVHDGDAFLTNDPWYGPVHQQDMTIAAPVFWYDEIVCWGAISIHEPDVGGPVPGSFSVGAKDCFGEAPLIPPLKIVEEGQERRDAIYHCLRNSRTPELLALDIKARLGGLNHLKRRIRELIEKYGKDTFLTFQEQLLEYVSTVVKERLRSLPDGVWSASTYHDHDGTDNILYPVHLVLTKQGEKLTFDFRGSSPQAPGIINCTLMGLHAGISAALFTLLCYELPWSSGGLNDIYEVIVDEGSIVNATFPAGVSGGFPAVIWNVTDLTNYCLGQMLACSARLRDEASSVWAPGYNGTFLSGLDRDQKPFVDVVLDGTACGDGALVHKDGIDSGGSFIVLQVRLSNVELQELNFPKLVLWRRESGETAGPGKFRGGCGLEEAFMPHKAPIPLTDVVCSFGHALPLALGMLGGYPGSVQANVIARNTNIKDILSHGVLPTRLEGITASEVKTLPAKHITELGFNDIHIAVYSGGGGYGDPLERDPRLVRKDLANGLCTTKYAADVYGVIFSDTENFVVDTEATFQRRQEIRDDRLRNATHVGTTADNNSTEQQIGNIQTLTDCLAIGNVAGGKVICCPSCQHIYGPHTSDPRLGAAFRERALIDLSEVNKYATSEDICLREFFCPGCGLLIAVDVVRTNDEVTGSMWLRG